MKTMKSFVRQFIAIVKGDDAEAQGQKVLRQADSALRTQVAALKGDVINLEDRVTEAKEKLASARVNFGNVISSRESYVKTLLDSKNAVTTAEENLKVHEEKIAFLEAELKALDAEA